MRIPGYSQSQTSFILRNKQTGTHSTHAQMEWRKKSNKQTNRTRRLSFFSAFVTIIYFNFLLHFACFFFLLFSCFLLFSTFLSIFFNFLFGIVRKRNASEIVVELHSQQMETRPYYIWNATAATTAFTHSHNGKRKITIYTKQRQ